MVKSRTPLLVNINGAPHIGVSTACHRVASCLNAQGIITNIIALERGIDAINFEDDYLIDMFSHVDVIIFDKHRSTESAIKRRLNQPLWFDDSVKPNLSVLLSCHADVYKRFIWNSECKRKALAQHENYLTCPKEHYGTSNHHVIDIEGKHGHLYAAGTIKSLILRELRR